MISELTHIRTGNVLRNAQSGLPSGLYRILIPAGTHLWRSAADTFLADEPANALLSFDSPPVAPGEPCGPDTRNTLQRLWAGATLSFYSPERSGSLTLSQPESTSQFRADRDRWLYLQLTFPAGKALAWKSQIDLHADAAISSSIELHPSTDTGTGTNTGTGTDTGTSQPAVDPALYARTQELVVRVGLVQSMYRLSGCTNNSDFEKKAIESGVWPGLIEMVRLAGGKQ